MRDTPDPNLLVVIFPDGPDGGFLPVAEFAGLTAERDALRYELDHFANSGIIEVAVRNASVSEYMHHWEGRAEKAEAEIARLREGLEAIAQSVTPFPRHEMARAILGMKRAMQKPMGSTPPSQDL